MSAGLGPGARVRILTGAAGGRTGVVVSAYQGQRGPIAIVQHERPVLLTVPDGPREIVRLPYAASELEVLAPEPTPTPAVERAPRDVAARGTAAHALALARRRGLHGRAALADAYQDLTATMLFLLRQDDPRVGQWGRATTLVFERWTALDDGDNAAAAASSCGRSAGEPSPGPRRLP